MAAIINVPLAGQPLSDSRPSIQANFASLAPWAAINHIEYGQPDEGKHTKIHMSEHPNPVVTAASEGAVFTRLGANSNTTELCFQREDSIGGGGEVIPMTEANIANPGWTYLPSGIQIFWGIGATTGGPLVVNFVDGGFSHACLAVTVTPTQAGTKNYFLVRTFLPGSFVCESYDSLTHGSAVTFNYIAIGY